MEKDGKVTAKVKNPAVTEEVLKSVYSWMMEGTIREDIIIRLRQKTVPSGNSYHYWSQGQLQYRYEILEWEKKGVPFCTRLYVPEVHPQTGLPFQEQEDETHVFKVYYLHLNKMYGSDT